MENEIIGVKCPQCGKILKIRKPEKPGIYQLTCKDCGNNIKLQLRAQPIKLEEKKDEQASPAPAKKKQQVPVLGKAELVEGKGVYCIKTPANINQPYAFLCPQCGKPVLLQATKTGVKSVACKLCGTKTYIKVVDPAQEAEKAKAAAKKPAKPAKAKKQEEQEEQPVKTMKVRSKNQRSTGMLTWGNIFRRKKQVLHEGSYIIGRKDSTYPSDIEFDDDEMSRRSVLLEVIKKNDGFYYKLTVKKATNPVLHNNKELEEQESVYLNFGDAFQIGRTVIHFEKADK
jgi:transcription elongation factor Elf1